MSLKPLLHGLGDVAGDLWSIFAPSFLGALIGAFNKRGLTWRQRLWALFVGACVAQFVSEGAQALFGWPEPVADASGFLLGLIACEAAPAFTKAAIESLGAVPEIVRKKFGGEA